MRAYLLNELKNCCDYDDHHLYAAEELVRAFAEPPVQSERRWNPFGVFAPAPSECALLGVCGILAKIFSWLALCLPQANLD